MPCDRFRPARARRDPRAPHLGGDPMRHALRRPFLVALGAFGVVLLGLAPAALAAAGAAGPAPDFPPPLESYTGEEGLSTGQVQVMSPTVRKRTRAVSTVSPACGGVTSVSGTSRPLRRITSRS